MSAFLFAVNRINLNYGEEVKLTKSEKLLHSYKVLGEWQSAREQLHLEKIYNSEHGIHLGDKLWKNQQYNVLKVYDNLCANSGDKLENLDTIKNELIRSAKCHNVTNKHRYIQELKSCSPEFTMTLETTSSDIAGIQDSQSYSLEYTISPDATTSDITGK